MSSEERIYWIMFGVVLVLVSYCSSPPVLLAQKTVAQSLSKKVI